MTGVTANADTLAANNFIPGFRKMVREESYFPKQVCNLFLY
jgi:hypothetical protein